MLRDGRALARIPSARSLGVSDPRPACGGAWVTELVEVSLPEPRAQRLEQVAVDLRPLWPSPKAELDLGALRRRAAEHPDLSRLWQEIRRRAADSAAVVVHGLPIEVDAFLVALTMALGRPSAAGNGDGLIHEVRPKPADEQRDISSTSAEFPLHTDSTALVEPHAFVCLACARAPRNAGGVSLVLSVSAVRSVLKDRYGSEVLRALEAPVFPFPLNDPAHGQGIREAPILERVAGDHTIRYRRDTLRRGLPFRPDALSRQHRDALAALDEVLADTRLHVAYSLTPGDVLLIDNRRALHGRTAITKGAARHLRRLKVFAAPPGG